MFELLRKFSLFMLLFIVALSTYLTGQSSTDWRHSLDVRVYPISGDNMPVTSAYIDELAVTDFASIETFMQSESERYSVSLNQPVTVSVGPTLTELPPPPPKSANPISIIYWSLKLRWWASNVTGDDDPDVKLFLVYFDPEITPSLQHSVGLRKGLVGIVNVFARADQAETNNFVIAHEMLHTLGASDKYAGARNLPAHPAGYADPHRTPLYPQSEAELMGGRIPISAAEAVIPLGLSQARIGPETATEIRWLE